MDKITWILRIALALLFVSAGYKKLIDAPAMALLFDQIALGKWFQYFTGASEILAAVLLLVPSTAFWGAALGAATMLGALVTNLIVSGIEQSGTKAALSAVLFAIALFIAWRMQPEFVKVAIAQLGHSSGAAKESA